MFSEKKSLKYTSPLTVCLVTLGKETHPVQFYLIFSLRTHLIISLKRHNFKTIILAVDLYSNCCACSGSSQLQSSIRNLDLIQAVCNHFVLFA